MVVSVAVLDAHDFVAQLPDRLVDNTLEFGLVENRMGAIGLTTLSPIPKNPTRRARIE